MNVKSYENPKMVILAGGRTVYCVHKSIRMTGNVPYCKLPAWYGRRDEVSQKDVSPRFTDDKNKERGRFASMPHQEPPNERAGIS